MKSDSAKNAANKLAFKFHSRAMQVSMGDTAQFSEIWEDALRVYQSETHRDLLRDKALESLQSTDDLLAHLEAQESKFKAFTEKKKKLWSVLKASMKPVEFLGDVARAALQGTPFASAGAIFTATSYLIGSAKGVSDAYASIIELLEQLADFSDRLEEYSKDVIDAKLRKKITLILATLLEILAKSERAIARGRIKEFAKVAFLGKDDGIADALIRLQMLVEAEGRFVAAKTFSTTQKLDKDMGKISSSLIESRKEKGEETNRKVVDDALSSGAILKVAEIQARNAHERQDGSGDWLKNEKLYESWLKVDEPILFILGGPGCGKSFLASTVVSHLVDRHPEVRASTRVSVGYFYIQEDDAQLRSLNTVLKSVAYQLQDDDAVYAKYLTKACSSPQKTLTATDTWKNLFLDYFGSSKDGEKLAFVVLDGIDEAPRKEREMLLRLLKDLEDRSKFSTRPRIQVLLIGRPDLREDTVLVWDKPIAYIEVSARKTKVDILAYIKGNVGRVRALKQTREPLESRLQLRKEIITKLSNGANGMFLWVNLMLDQIYNMSRPSDIHNALNNAPRSLSKMIRHTFERLDEDLRGFSRDDFKEILAWVTCAQRPLRLVEMRTVLRLRPPLGEGVPDLEERLRGQFASFFTLKRRDGLTTEALLERAANQSDSKGRGADAEAGPEDNTEKSVGDDGDDESDAGAQSSDEFLLLEAGALDFYDSDIWTTTIQFSHASIRDYLIRESNPATREFPADLGISINTAEAEKHLAMTCLQILTEELKMAGANDLESNYSSDGASADNDSDDDSEGHNESRPVYDLEDYAGDNFIKHLTHTQKSTLTGEDQQLITRSLLHLFVNQKSLTHWIDGTSILAALAFEWLYGARYAEFVRGWFLDQLLNSNHYSEAEVEQMRKLSESDRELLRNLAMECARYWLTVGNDYKDIRGFFSFLEIYVPRGEDENESTKATEFTSGRFSEARLQKLAEFPNFEQTSFWHSQLSEAMRQTEHADAAIKGFRKAIELNDKNWVAMGRLSFCYESLELYKLAAEWSRKALDFCPTAGHKWERSDYWQTIASCLLDLENINGAKSAAKEALKLKPEDGGVLSTYVFILDAAGDQSELFSYLEDLQSHISEENDNNLLTVALMGNDYILEALGHNARAIGKLDFLIKAQETVIEAATRDENFAEVANQQNWLANLYYVQLRDQKKAVELWELVLKNKDASTAAMQTASGNLSMVYYAEGMVAETEQGTSPRRWVTKLEKLAKYDHNSHEASPFAASLMLGTWYREHGNIIEARNCCRAYVLQVLDMLSDDEPYNDSTAWFSLSTSLVKAGDRVNAAVADAVIVEEIDKVKAAIARMKLEAPENSETATTTRINEALSDVLPPRMAAQDVNSPPKIKPRRPAVPGVAHPRSSITSLNSSSSTLYHDVTTSSWFCDGQCRRGIETWEELYICEICLDTICFCEQCVHLIRDGKLDFGVCDRKHTWYRAYPVREGWGRVDTAEEVARERPHERPSEGERVEILVDGRKVELGVWLEELREAWAKGASDG